MKKITILITVKALLLIIGSSYGQTGEKRIQFNNGTLKICTSSNMNITGYDGDEVIIKSLYDDFRYNNTLQSLNISNQGTNISGQINSIDSTNLNLFNNYFGNRNDQKVLEKGLKPLGNKSTNPADNLYLDIEEKSGELIIKDYKHKRLETNLLAVNLSRKYELLIPNSIKLLWNVENCKKTRGNVNVFINSSTEPWQLSNFKGEVEISSAYSSLSLLDVSGPVLINTLGGNIKVVFDKTSPNELYSLISNNGYIDIALPRSANINIDAIGKRILSDIDFKVLDETIVNGTKGMELRLNSGKTRMKIDAGSGSIYLRKK